MRDSSRVSVVKVEETQSQRVDDDVVIEEPLEIRVNGDSLSVTMRTPGDDFDLAVGLLWTEGIIRSRDEIGTIAYCPDEEQPELKNIVNVVLVDTTRKIESSRRLWSNSSCGLCGKATLESIHQVCQPVASSIVISRELLFSLPSRLRQAQANFERTGGIHAVGLFDEQGSLLVLREDIGRHNAVDKVLGAALVGGLPVSETIMMVSGRLGFEIAQKALVAGIPVVASISAASSLAIELANDLGMTTIGFLRGRSMNVYSHPERIAAGGITA
ncbi:MAG: formate dehydrogenase accessory sulfurtransferase FdhD [Acidobacteria bacterium]|nr:MAG: formate dehydrogenase accessory sulfurtransferase FdhD [Acidobacteriota bacterium]